MSRLFFTGQHEWVRFTDASALVGIMGKLEGDVVYVELPELGRRVYKGEICARVEAVKAAVEVCSPVAGVVRAVNDALYDDPDEIARHPQQAWLFEVDCGGEADLEGLIPESEYNRI